jgi:Rrf2 family protein
MRLQTATRIAIYALLDLAGDPSRSVSAGEIAERFGISVNHLAKVMRTLGRAGLVEASRGVGGGYRFRGNARRLTLLDIVLLFENPTSAASNSESELVTSEGRALDQVLGEIDDIALATFNSITVATLLKLVDRSANDDRVTPQ